MCTFIDIVYVVIKIYTYSMDYADHGDVFCSIPKYDCYHLISLYHNIDYQFCI